MTTLRQKMKGGEVIGRGGFGCVFNPQIANNPQVPCEIISSSGYTGPKISKLMRTVTGRKEFNFVQKINRLLRHIDNYEEYFILDDIELCTPTKLEINQLKRCNMEDLTPESILKNWPKFVTLNMPHGGIDVYTVFRDIYLRDKEKKDNESPYDLRIIHRKLVDLFQYAIIPMNQRKVYHCDIKSHNLVYNIQNHQLKLIDWGLSFINNEDGAKQKIPDDFRNYSFNFNFPLGTVLLSTEFEVSYGHFLQSGGDLFPFVIQVIYSRLHNGRRHHLPFIEQRLQRLYKYVDIPVEDKSHFGDEEYFRYNWTLNLIGHHLVAIITNKRYHDERNQFSPRKYFEKGFLLEVDVCGFLSTYGDLFLLLKTHVLSTVVMNQIIKILKTYVYDPPVSEIRVHDVLHDLHELTEIIESTSSKRGGGYRQRKRKSRRPYQTLRRKKRQTKRRKSQSQKRRSK
jgi:serine/threonine protein kinase